MSHKQLSTESYKGVRDFYPADLAIQRYIFDTWATTAERFGFERYDASVLEPADLYRSKGAENAEMVDEQTYTFTDRGDREVTLRPEMTPSVARMVAGRRHELVFPLRWYSIPNLFRYERMQRGRLREHWQLNCDLFGANDVAADVELIALAHQLLLDFGATSDMFEIKINDRGEMKALFAETGVTDEEMVTRITRLNDRKAKISSAEYGEELLTITNQNSELANRIRAIVEDDAATNPVLDGLHALGIDNVHIDRAIARGFNYYTGTIFEVFDKHPDGSKRSMLGGGRYDNLTTLFGGEAISGIGFGMGDVTMRDFLETHNLLTDKVTSTTPTLTILPTDTELNLGAQKLAHTFRMAGIKVAVDIGTKKLDKKLRDANKRAAPFVLVFGETEQNSATYTLKRMADGDETSGGSDALISTLKENS